MQGRIANVLALVSLLGMLNTASWVFAATIDTPMTAVECQPLSLNWHNADPSGQVYISLVEGKDTAAAPILQFQPQPGSPEGVLTWPKVNVTAGTQFTLIVNDASGKPNFSGQVNVQKGPESGTCGAVGTGSSAGSTSTGSSTVPSTTPSTTPSNTPSTSTTPSNTGSSSSSSGTTSPSTVKPSTGSTTNSSSSTTKPTSGTSGATVSANVHPVTMASFAIVIGSVLAVNVL